MLVLRGADNLKKSFLRHCFRFFQHFCKCFQSAPFNKYTLQSSEITANFEKKPFFSLAESLNLCYINCGSDLSGSVRAHNIQLNCGKLLLYENL